MLVMQINKLLEITVVLWSIINNSQYAVNCILGRQPIKHVYD